MEALEYEKARIRMCNTMILKEGGCEACSVYDGLKHRCMISAAAVSKSDEDALKKNIDKVIKWAKDHPAKTRQSEFLKMFPDVKFDGGVPILCPMNFMAEEAGAAYCGKHGNCIKCRKGYWLEEMTDND